MIFDDEEGGNARGSHAEVHAMQRTIDRRLVAFTESLASDVDLTRVVAIERPTRVERERVDDALFHMTTYVIDHRGQVHAMLAGTSVVPPQLDEYFLAVDRPKAETELASAGFDTSARR